MVIHTMTSVGARCTTYSERLAPVSRLSCLALAVVLVTPAYAGAVPEAALKDLEDGYYRRALTIIEPLVKTNPDDAEVQFCYGQALVGAGKADPAIAALEAAIEINPNNGIYHRVLGEAYGLKAQSAGVFSMFGLMKSTRNEFQRAVELAPEDLRSHVNLAMFHIMAPGMAGGSLEKAHAEEAVIDQLDEVQGLRVRATEAINQDDAAAGERLFKQAVDKDKTAESLLALGMYYSEAKSYDEAFKTFAEAQAKDPMAYSAWYQIGKTAGLAKANYAAGIEALNQYLAFEDKPDTVPSIAWARFRLAILYEYQGHVDLARDEYQQARSMNDGDERLSDALDDAEARLD